MEKRLANAINQRLVRLEKLNEIKMPPGISGSSLWQLRAIRQDALTVPQILKSSKMSQNKISSLLRTRLARIDAIETHDQAETCYTATEEGRALLSELDRLKIWETPLPGKYRSDKKDKTRLGIEHRL